MTEPVKRYSYGFHDDGFGEGRHLGLIEKPDGALVRYDDYARLEQECERLRVKLMTIASAEPARHNIEWAKAMAAECNNEVYAQWREAFGERNTALNQADVMRDLLTRCQEHLDPHRDAALWSDVCAALGPKP